MELLIKKTCINNFFLWYLFETLSCQNLAGDAVDYILHKSVKLDGRSRNEDWFI